MMEVLVILKKLVLTRTVWEFSDRQWGRGTFSSSGIVTYTLPIAVNTVLFAWAIDDVEAANAGTIGWVTSQTDGQRISFACSIKASQFVYAAICRQ